MNGPSRRIALAGVLALAADRALSRQRDDEGTTPPREQRGRKQEAKRWQSLPPTPTLPPVAWARAPIGGTQIAYAEFGQGDPVVFLHGGMGHSAFWGHQLKALMGQYRVILMDTRGHGRSEAMKGPYGFGIFAKDVEGLLDRLGIEKASIVGWSDGGITGLQLAMTSPNRIKRLFAFGANVTPAGLIGGGSKKPAFARYVAHCRADCETFGPPERWSQLSAGLGAMWRREPNFSKEMLSAIKVPTTIAYAPYDEIIRPAHAEGIAASIPGATVTRLSDVSHFAMLQDHAGFNDALRAFLTT